MRILAPLVLPIPGRAAADEVAIRTAVPTQARTMVQPVSALARPASDGGLADARPVSALVRTASDKDLAGDRLVSALVRTVSDEALAGDRLGPADTATAGRFAGQRFARVGRAIASGGDPAAAARAIAADGHPFGGRRPRRAGAPQGPRGACPPDPQRPRARRCPARRIAPRPARRRARAASRGEALAALVPGPRARARDPLLADAFRRAAKRLGAEIAAVMAGLSPRGGLPSRRGDVTAAPTPQQPDATGAGRPHRFAAPIGGGMALPFAAAVVLHGAAGVVFRECGR